MNPYRKNDRVTFIGPTYRKYGTVVGVSAERVMVEWDRENFTREGIVTIRHIRPSVPTILNYRDGSLVKMR